MFGKSKKERAAIRERFDGNRPLNFLEKAADLAEDLEHLARENELMREALAEKDESFAAKKRQAEADHIAAQNEAAMKRLQELEANLIPASNAQRDSKIEEIKATQKRLIELKNESSSIMTAGMSLSSERNQLYDLLKRNGAIPLSADELRTKEIQRRREEYQNQRIRSVEQVR